MNLSKSMNYGYFLTVLLWIIPFVYLLASPWRGDSNKYPKRMFSQRITWDCQWKNTRSADFCADRIDLITSFAVITNAVIKRVHGIFKKSEWSLGLWIKEILSTYKVHSTEASMSDFSKINEDFFWVLNGEKGGNVRVLQASRLWGRRHCLSFLGPCLFGLSLSPNTGGSNKTRDYILVLY